MEWILYVWLSPQTNEGKTIDDLIEEIHDYEYGIVNKRTKWLQSIKQKYPDLKTIYPSLRNILNFLIPLKNTCIIEKNDIVS